MNPERWRIIDELFHAALSKSPEERTAFLRDASDGDEELLQEIESLIASHEQTSSFIDGSALESSLEMLADDPAEPLERIGPYRLIKELGEGGMGVVYLAARDDREYDKRVAIKVSRHGITSALTRERFRTERQILAGFDHPNIARLLDGGTTPNGLPYIVMEYVEGLGIDQYCDEHRLTVVERLKLFCDVCAAVHYAHQRLVIHRDIKPSNILVTEDGTPKLLDFGIAKLLDPETSDYYSPETATVMRMMTPEYASPEQIRGEHITTPSDIYSLGVVLYELLTGHSPYKINSRSPAEVVQAITEGEPERPSEAIFRIDQAKPSSDARTSDITPELVSETREGSPEKLRRRLRGDLDNIVLMAMRKEPERRYVSAQQFAQDLRRYLAGRTVFARKDTLGYRASKFIRRNRLAVAGATLICLILISGIIATTRQSRIAQSQRAIAATEKARAERRFNDVRKIAHSVLFDYYDKITNLPGSTPVREKMVKDMLDYVGSLASESRGDPSLQMELADAYDKISSVQGGSAYANLGNTAGAIDSRRKAIQIREALLSEDANNAAARLALSNSYRSLGMVLDETSDQDGALTAYRKAVQTAEPLVVNDPSNVEYKRMLAYAYGDLGEFLVERGAWQDAMDNELRAVNMHEALLAANPNDELARRSLSVGYESISQIQLQTNHPDEALQNQSKAVELQETLSRNHPQNTELRSLLSAGYYYYAEVQAYFAKNLGRREFLSKALDNYRKSADIDNKIATEDPENTQARNGASLLGAASMLEEMGRLSEAVALTRKALRMRQTLAASDPANLWKRFLVIEAAGKMAGILAKTTDAKGTLTECQTTMKLITAVGSQQLDGDLLSAKAESLGEVAGAYYRLASSGGNAGGENREFWQAARRCYLQSLDILLDMKKRGTLSSTEESAINEIRRKISKCDSAVGR